MAETLNRVPRIDRHLGIARRHVSSDWPWWRRQGSCPPDAMQQSFEANRPCSAELSRRLSVASPGLHGGCRRKTDAQLASLDPALSGAKSTLRQRRLQRALERTQ